MEVQLLEPLTALTNKLYQKGLESDLNAVMRRYEELKRDSKAKASRNLAVANIFGIMNSILGLVTALFSVISIFFTYYKNPNLSIYSSL
ncbi:MAG: hypothetical protein JOZ78_03100, partial [Chroococcidiopsidaceae cyanobacterium CP_BM_ER_R8_30]|nr:hypothetical protein [Chroococcidiopsidaceae cyanobacterium CP_BM_ER_R8_30]